MATESKDIELRVRARDYSQKTLDNVTKALDELTKAQEEQLKGAKNGQVSAAALEASYRKIEQAVQALVKQGNLVNLYNDQAEALAKAKDGADKAREAQTAYAATLANVEEKTKQQIASQKKLATAVAQADQTQLRAQTRLDKTAASLASYGIAVDQIQVAQKRLAEGVAIGNAALAQQEVALESVEADIKRVAAQEAQISDQKKKWAAEDIAAQKSVAAAMQEAAARRQKMLEISNQVEKSNFDAARAEQAVANAMRATAQQAEATAKGYQVLARSVKSVRGNELADQLKAILDPSAVAASNLNGLDDTLGNLSNRIKAINGPVKDFRGTMAALNETMKGISGIATQIDAYRRQIDVLKAARAEYASARAAVLQLTAQMRAGGGDAAELGRQLGVASNRLKQASQDISSQISKTREMREALRTAGVSTKDLGDAQARLVAQAKTATAAVGTLSDAYKKHGSAAEDSAKSVFKFFDGQRTTLSFAQRMRGELLALATAYIGVQAAVNLARESLAAYNTLARVNSGLVAANAGDVRAAAADYQYLREAADRIGFSFKEAAPAFAKFSIAAKAFGLTTQETRFTFEKFAEASIKAGVSASDFEGVLKALEQMLSKGTIQAEELRGQLGDRLPGAFVFLAKSMGVTTAELGKMLEAGDVTADKIVGLARTYSQEFKGVDDGTRNLLIAQNNFSNAVTDFLQKIAQSGFADAFTTLLNKLSDFMKSADGAKLAQQLGAAFTGLTNILITLVDNVDSVKLAFEVIIALSLIRWVYGAYRGFVLLAETLGPLLAVLKELAPIILTLGGSLLTVAANSERSAGGVAGFIGRLKQLIALIPGLGALVTTIQAGITAYDRFQAAKAKSDGQAAPNRKAIDNMGLSPTSLAGRGTEDPGVNAAAEQKRKIEKINEELEKSQKKSDKNLVAARKRSAKDEIGERADIIKEGYDQRRKAIETEITDQTKKAELLKKLDSQMNNDLLADKLRYDAEHAKSGAASAAKEVTLKEQVKNELLRIQSDLLKQETKLDQNASFDDRRKTRIDAITHAYDGLRKTISKLSSLDKAAAADATAKLEVYVKQLQGVEEQKVTLEEIKRLEKELEDQQKLRTLQLQQQQSMYDAGLVSQEQFLANTAQINKTADTAVTTAANNLQKFVDAAVKARDGILDITSQQEVKTKVTTAITGTASTDRKAAEAQNKATEDAINNLVAKRAAAEAILKAQLETRQISEDQYAAAANANADTYKNKIVELTTALQAQLEAQRQLGILNGTLNVEQIAALDAQIARVQLLNTQTANALPTLDMMGKSISNFMTQGIDTAFNSLAQTLTDLATGAKSTGDAFKALGQTVAQFVAQFLLDIAKAIAKQLILNALANAGGPIGMAAKAAGGVIKRHEGGRISKTGNGIRRDVNPQWFVGAPRFHEGGLPGLKSDEVPAILQTGEQVLARNDPNNILNAKAGGSERGMRFVLVDDRSKIPEAMASAEGDEVITRFLKRNSATVRSIVKG